MTSDDEQPTSTLQQDAAKIAERLDELISEVEDARDGISDAQMAAGKRPPSERVMALISDSASLAEGVSNGSIRVGQPRIVANLLQVIHELDDAGHFPLACSFTNIVRWVSTRGIAADGCVLVRSPGIGPQL